MPIYRDKKRGTFVFEFDVRIGGERVRATKHLPKTWSRAQADEFDRKESAALYARAQGIGRDDQAIEDAVNLYLMHRATVLKHGRNVAAELALIYPHYKGRPMSALADVCKAIQICNQARILRNAWEPAWILGLCVCIQRRKSAVFAQLVKKFPCGLGSHFSAALALSYCRSQAAS